LVIIIVRRVGLRIRLIHGGVNLVLRHLLVILRRIWRWRKLLVLNLIRYWRMLEVVLLVVGNYLLVMLRAWISLVHSLRYCRVFLHKILGILVVLMLNHLWWGHGATIVLSRRWRKLTHLLARSYLMLLHGVIHVRMLHVLIHVRLLHARIHVGLLCIERLFLKLTTCQLLHLARLLWICVL